MWDVWLSCDFHVQRYIGTEGQTDDEEDMYMGTKPVVMVGWNKAQR